VIVMVGGLALDAQGRAAITGQTRSTNFPTTPGAYRRTIAGGTDAWVALFAPDPEISPEEQLVWSTLLGGSDFEGTYVLTLDPDGGIWVAGQTFTGFPTTTGSFKTVGDGQSEGFISKFNPALSGRDQLVYSSLVGGSGWEWLNGIAASSSGEVAVVGVCDAQASVPVTAGSLQRSFAGSVDGFLVVLRPDPALDPQEQLIYSTFIGGGAEDWATAALFRPAQQILVAGYTFSSAVVPFPDERIHGWQDSYVMNLDLRVPDAAFTIETDVSARRIVADAGGSVTPPGTSITKYGWNFGDGSPLLEGPASRVEHVYEPAGIFDVLLTVTNDAGLQSEARQTVAFPCATTGDVSPWTAVDIGDPQFPGSSRKDGDCISICAGGTTLSGKVDKLHFAYQEVTGDFDSAVRVEEVEGGSSVQLGLMARESLEPGAAMAVMGISGASASIYFRFFYRTTTDINCATKLGTKTAVPAWLRLRRKGDTVSGYKSTDGSYWNLLSSMQLKESPEKLLVGVFGIGKEPTADTPFEALRARICLEGPQPSPFRRGDANVDGTSDISDAVSILSYLFLGTEAVTCKKSADTNDDGALDTTDGVYLLEFLFRGGMAPPQPLEDCGMDPTKDELTCESFARC
jgi:hypothetical protein